MDGEGTTSGRRSDTFAGRVVLVAAVVLILFLAWTWRHVLMLLFASILIAVGLHGLAKPLSRKLHIRKHWALAGAAIIVLGALVGAGWLFGSQIGGQIGELQSRLPESLEAARGWIESNPIGQRLAAQADSMGSGAGVVSALGRAGGWTLTLLSGTLDALVVLVAAAFLSVDPRPYREGFLLLVPKDVRPEFEGALDDSAHALRKWLVGTLISMATIAILIGVSLWLLGVPAFLALALIAGLAQFVPLVGPLLASIPGILLALTVGADTALWTALVYVAASQLEANLVTPLIQKRAVSLPPALTLFAILAMGLLLGPLGVLFGVPLTVVASILVVRLYVNRALGESVTPPGRG